MKNKGSELASNRKAFYNYEILEQFEAGVALKGTEVKSLRDGGGSLLDAYVVISGSEAFLKNASIAPYKQGNIHNHEERRPRKLLLHKREIEKLLRAESEKGLTIIPLSFYLKSGLVKVKVALARGKKLHDKRSAIKERELKREVARNLKR